MTDHLNSTLLTALQIKFELILSEDVGGDTFQAKVHGFKYVSDFGLNSVPKGHMEMIFVFWIPNSLLRSLANESIKFIDLIDNIIRILQGDKNAPD